MQTVALVGVIYTLRLTKSYLYVKAQSNYQYDKNSDSLRLIRSYPYVEADKELFIRGLYQLLI